MGFLSKLFKKERPRWEILKEKRESREPQKSQLERRLDSSDADTRKRTVQELGELAEPQVVPILVAVIREEDEFVVRLAAMDAMYYIGQKCTKGNMSALVDQLLDVVNDSNWQVREKVARALGDAGDPRAAEPLIALLKDSESWVRRNAAWSLEMTGDTRAIEPLIAALQDSDEQVRGNAAAALGKIGEMRAVEPLIALQRDPDPYVNIRAEAALKSIAARLPEAEKSVRNFMQQLESERLAEQAEQERLVQTKIEPARNMSDDEMSNLLKKLCSAYEVNDTEAIARLEPLASAIGERLNHRGGLSEMRRVFHKVEGIRGARTLEMHWGGIGDWRG